MAENEVAIKVTAKDLASQVLKNVSKSVDDLAGSITKKLSQGFEDLTNKVKNFAIIGGGAIAGFLGYGVKIAAELETSRQGFITLLGSAEKADAVISRLKVESARTPFELPGLTRATQLLTSVTKDGDKSIDILLDVGKALASMGRGQEEMDRIIINLQQVGSLGHATMLDIKQFAFSGIPIFELLSETFGKTGQELEDFITEGGVTFDALVEMFKKAGNEGGRFANAFINQSGTFGQLMSNAKDAFGLLMADIVTKTGLFDGIKKAIIKVNTALIDNKDAIINLIKEGIEKLKNILHDLKDIVTDVFYFFFDSKEDFLEFAKIFGLVSSAIIGVTIALGILTSPITAAIGAITLVTSIIYLWINGNDEVKAAIIGIASAFTIFLIPTLLTAISTITAFITTALLIPTLVGAAIALLVYIFVFNFDKVKEYAQAFVEFLGTLFTYGFEFIKSIIISFFEIIYSRFVFYFELIKGIVSAAFEFIKDLISGVLDIIIGIVTLDGDRIKEGFTRIKDGGIEAFNKLKEGIIAAINSVVEPIMSVINKILGAVGSVKNAIGGLVESSKWVEAQSQKIAALKVDTAGIGNLGAASGAPMFASGTDFAPGGVAIVGEQGPELVNLPRGSQVKTASETEKILSNKASIVNNINITISGAEDPMSIAQKIQAILTQQNQAAMQGFSLGIA